MKNFYQWLKISPEATPEQVATAVWQRMDSLRRQKKPLDESQAAEWSARIKTVGQVLMNGESRAKYDKLLESHGVEVANREILVEPLPLKQSPESRLARSSPGNERTPNVEAFSGISPEKPFSSGENSALPTISSADSRAAPWSVSKKKSGDGLARPLMMIASIVTAGLSAVCVSAVILWNFWGIDPFGLFSKTPSAQTTTVASNDLPSTAPADSTGKPPLANTHNRSETAEQRNPVPTNNHLALDQSNRPKGSDNPKPAREDASRNGPTLTDSAGGLLDKLNALPEEEPKPKGNVTNRDAIDSLAATKYLAPAPERSEEQKKAISQRNEQLLAELQLRTRLLPLPMDLPIQPLAGDIAAYHQYVHEVLEAKRKQNRAIRQLNDATSKALDDLSRVLLAKEDGQAEAQHAISIAKLLNVDEVFQVELPDKVNSELKIAVKKHETESERIDSEFEKQSSNAADQFLKKIDELIRLHSRNVEDPRSMASLLQYRELMRLRQIRSLQGNFVLLTDGKEYPKLYCGGKAIQLGNNGVSKNCRLELQKDVIALDMEAIEPGTKFFLAFVTKDLNHQLFVEAKDVHLMNVHADLRALSRKTVWQAKLVANRVDSDQDGNKRKVLLQLPSDKGDWFSIKEATKILALNGSYSSLVSRHGELTRRTPLQLPNLEGLDVLDVPADRQVLILHQSFEGSPAAIADEFRKYSMETKVVEGYQPDREDFSEYHTIVLAENFLRVFDRQNLGYAQPFVEFMEQGGHLFVLGTFNGEGGKPFLRQFGIETGFFHNHSFEPNGLPTALFLWGNESLVPPDRALVSTGNFSCSSAHTLILKRGRGNTVLDLKMLTKKIGDGRFTYSNIQPEVGEGRWFRTAMANWISRGAPTTKE